MSKIKQYVNILSKPSHKLKIKNQNDRIQFVKIDVQGAEEEVLKGMERILKKNRDIKILIEFWPRGLEMAGFAPNTCLDLLLKQRFRFYDINEWEKKYSQLL